MKRYMVFGGSYFYPRGGMLDFLDSFDDYKESEAVVYEYLSDEDSSEEWIHVYDSQEGVIVFGTRIQGCDAPHLKCNKFLEYDRDSASWFLIEAGERKNV